MTAFLHMRATQVDNKPKLEEWLNSILKASQQWKDGAWAGRIVLRPLKKKIGLPHYVSLQDVPFDGELATEPRTTMQAE